MLLEKFYLNWCCKFRYSCMNLSSCDSFYTFFLMICMYYYRFRLNIIKFFKFTQDFCLILHASKLLPCNTSLITFLSRRLNDSIFSATRWDSWVCSFLKLIISIEVNEILFVFIFKITIFSLQILENMSFYMETFTLINILM